MAKENNPERPIVDPDADPGTDLAAKLEPDPDAGGGDAAGGGGRSTGTMSPFREKAATWTAIGALVALGYFYVHMLGHIGDPDKDWARRLGLLGGAETIVFAAASFLFGTQIQRRVQAGQVASAERNAEEKEREAKRAQLRAEREARRAEAAKEAESRAKQRAQAGEMLSELVLAKTESSGKRGRAYGGLGGKEKGDLAEADFEELRRLAEKISRANP